MFLFNAHVNGQTSSDDIVFDADLTNMFALTVTAGGNQNAVFVTTVDYNAGIPVVGFSTVQVESTDNWNCSINASNQYFNNGTGVGNLPVNNVGLWCEALGTNTWGAGGEINLSQGNVDITTAYGITDVATPLFEWSGTGSNAGGVAENEFQLNWAMGTMDGTMNPTSMMTQIANGDFTLGTYTTTITLTATVAP